MGKPKKGKKLEDQDVDTEVQENDLEDDIDTKPKAKKEKKKKDLEETDSEDEGRPLKSSKGKKVKSSEDSDEINVVKEPLKSKKEKKGKGDSAANDVKSKGKKMKESDSDSDVPITATKGGFATLAVSDDDDDEEPPPAKESEDEEVEVVKKPKKDEKKGKKSRKKRKDEDEEDLDQILAELEMEYSGVPVKKPEEDAVKSEPKEDDKKKKKKDKKKEAVVTQESKDDDEEEEVEQEIVDKIDNEDNEEERTVKTAAQKKKEKKEREKAKKAAEKLKSKGQASKEPSIEKSEVQEQPDPEKEEKPEDDEEEGENKKKKKKKGKDKDKEEKDDKKKPRSKAIAAMQEALKKIKEEEEKQAAAEAERIKKEEEAEQARLEQIRLEQERKEKKKQKEKEKKERLKAEGKLLNAKQKADRARAQAMIEAMNKLRLENAASGITADKEKPAKKPVKPKKNASQQQPSQEAPPQPNGTQEPKSVEVTIVDKEPAKEEDDDVKDSWDIDSDKEEEISKPVNDVKVPEAKVELVQQKSKDESSSMSESSSEESSDEDSETDSEGESKSDRKTDAEKRRERVLERIMKRQEAAEKKKSLDELRAAVVCVLGHVDTGKTKILDKLRRTNVQDGEAGGITQQIGATNVPIDAIKEQAKIVKGFSQIPLKIPGLLIIDTPGHESFSNLRSRGSSLCDIAILVVDIMHGLEPQTLESINLLKQRKTPFIVALNKIDRLYDWQMMARKDIRDVIAGQAANTQLEFEQRTNEVIVQFAEQGLNAALFYNNPDVRSYVSLVPTSATTGEGMGNLLALIVDSCQTMLAKRLMFSEELQATVLEVKALPGLGTTIDVILVNGYLREGDTVVLAGTEAPIVTQIRSLLMPQPLKELRVKNAYVEYKEIKAAQGVKIAAKDFEKVIAGLNLRVAMKPDEVEVLKEEVAKELKHALSNIKLQERGVYVQASTLGSLEALLEFLRTSQIPYANIRIGPVVKKDVMKASTMLEHESQYAVILAFDVKIDRDAQELADSLGVKIFQADIIYHLFDKFIAYRDEIKAKKREEFKSIAVFPCRLRILPQFVFNSRDPIVVGVMVEAGIVRDGTPICVPTKDFIEIGVVTSIENNHKTVDSARKGQEVCIKIEPIPGESPKMFGRHFDEKDFLVSKISRQSIDACKDYFREDLVKTDWQLMVELKKQFQIL